MHSLKILCPACVSLVRVFKQQCGLRYESTYENRRSISLLDLALFFGGRRGMNPKNGNLGIQPKLQKIFSLKLGSTGSVCPSRVRSSACSRASEVEGQWSAAEPKTGCNQDFATAHEDRNRRMGKARILVSQANARRSTTQRPQHSILFNARPARLVSL